jgi:probable rRNA maturation factor
LVLTNDAQIQKLNRRFRGEDHVTDVLSFPEDEPDLETGQRYLGDVVISLQRARAQAKAGGHSLQAELQLLAVHGVLHLLGFDHGEAAEREAMWAAQDKILTALGSPLRSVEAEAQAQARR